MNHAHQSPAYDTWFQKQGQGHGKARGKGRSIVGRKPGRSDGDACSPTVATE